MKHTNRAVKRILILFFVFCVTILGVVFFMHREEREDRVYAPSLRPSLPVVYMEVEGERVNALHGYQTKMQAQYTRDTVTPLPEDRMLTVMAENCGEEIINISYEIRSLDTLRLVEDTQLKEWDAAEDGVTARLPIQNLLEPEKEYLLTLILSTKSRPAVYYYTRITLSEEFHTSEMMDFVKDFHEKTFDPVLSEELVIYMKQNTADRTTLANVTLHSTFSQITWGDLVPRQLSQPEMSIKDMNETIGSFTMSYLAEAENPDRENQTDIYRIEEFYCVQWSEAQWYLLAFQRTMNQVFDPDHLSAADRSIDLGIQESDGLQALKSEDGQWIVFAVNGQLWSYHSQTGELVRVFSFEQEEEQDIRNSLQEHEIQIVEADNEGNVHFFVYGYMNNGVHEGCVGMSFYEYNRADNELLEIFYLPSTIPYQVLKKEVGTLSYLSRSGLFYLMFGNSIYAIDFEGDEFVVVVEQVREEGMAISRDSSVIAWQDGKDVRHGTQIHVMNLDTVEQYTIQAKRGECIRVLDFIEKDLICGIARETDVDAADGLSSELYPMYAVEVYGQTPEPETRYEKSGVYISGVGVEPGSIKLYRMQKMAGGEYREIQEDALIQNSAREEESSQGLEQNYSEARRTVYVIPKKQGGTSETQKIEVISPSGMIAGTNEISLQGQKDGQEKDMDYYAFAYGKLQKVCGTAAEAIQLTYDDVGTVVYGDGNYVLRRGYRSQNGRKITVSAVAASSKEGSLAACLEMMVKMTGEVVNAAELLEEGREPAEILGENMPGNGHDLTGCGLEQVLYYYLSFGYPLIARTQDQGAVLITGYGYQDLYMYSPVTGEEISMGIDEAARYLERNGNVLIGYIP